MSAQSVLIKLIVLTLSVAEKKLDGALKKQEGAENTITFKIMKEL